MWRQRRPSSCCYRLPPSSRGARSNNASSGKCAPSTPYACNQLIMPFSRGAPKPYVRLAGSAKAGSGPVGGLRQRRAQPPLGWPPARRWVPPAAKPVRNILVKTGRQRFESLAPLVPRARRMGLVLRRWLKTSFPEEFAVTRYRVLRPRPAGQRTSAIPEICNLPRKRKGIFLWPPPRPT